MNIQRIDIRLTLQSPEVLAPEPFLSVFGRWRTEADRVERDRLLDLADYAHLPTGPRALLVGRDFHFGVDWQEDGAGILLSVRDGLEGTLAERLTGALRQAHVRALELLHAVELEARLSGELEVVFNDRKLAPNDDAHDAEVRPALEEALTGVFGAAEHTIDRDTRSGRRLGYRITY